MSSHALGEKPAWKKLSDLDHFFSSNIISMRIIWFAYFITDLMKLNQISIGSLRSWETCFLLYPVASWDKASASPIEVSLLVCRCATCLLSYPAIVIARLHHSCCAMVGCVIGSKEAAWRLCQGSHLQTSGREDSKGRASRDASLLLAIGENA